MSARPGERRADAREVMASAAGGVPEQWEVIAEPQREVWYDWACPETGKVGQCYMRADGSWQQAPRGSAPVVLAYLRRTGRRRTAPEAR